MSRQRQRINPTPQSAEITHFSHDGRGIAKISGKTTFIEGALPTEKVLFKYLRKKSDFDEGTVVEIIEPSNQRVEPQCAHYHLCGGCSLQHLAAKQQILEKQDLLIDLLQRIGHTQPEVILEPITSDVWHYRNKARLSVRFVEKKQATLVGFREKHNPRYITEITDCAVLNQDFSKQIILLRQLIDSFDLPANIAQVEVAAGDKVIALILRNLAPLSELDKVKLIEFGQTTDFHLYLQPAGVDSVHLFYPQDIEEFLEYELADHQIQFKFHPTDFTQINAGINRLMVNKAIELLDLQTEDTVLDLFCGLGNFSLPIAKYCKKVVGIEGSESMVKRATMNAGLNKIDNTEFYCADLDKPDGLNRINKQQFSKILIDPPRSGALEIIKQIDKLKAIRVVYVSCNPATLARDADILVNQHGYRLQAVGVMDMFPHTAHVESIALFEKIGSSYG